MTERIVFRVVFTISSGERVWSSRAKDIEEARRQANAPSLKNASAVRIETVRLTEEILNTETVR
jgi:hypothetical protein